MLRPNQTFAHRGWLPWTAGHQRLVVQRGSDACRDHVNAGHGGGGGGTRLRRVLLRWQAPQPCRSWPSTAVAKALDPYASGYARPYASPYAGHPRTPSPSDGQITAGHTPRGGVERALGKVRFARLIHLANPRARPGPSIPCGAVNASYLGDHR
jgi:hypothetical protein